MLNKRDKGWLSVEAVGLALAAFSGAAALHLIIGDSSDTTTALVGGAAHVGIVALSGGALIEGLWTGAIRGYFARYSRTQQPFDFWLTAGAWGFVFGLSLLLPIEIALHLLGV